MAVAQRLEPELIAVHAQAPEQERALVLGQDEGAIAGHARRVDDNHAARRKFGCHAVIGDAKRVGLGFDTGARFHRTKSVAWRSGTSIAPEPDFPLRLIGRSVKGINQTVVCFLNSAMAKTTEARAPRQDNRRQDILDAAARLFARQGYHATSIRDIAAAAEMLPGSVYYHFASKETLLLAVYAEGVARIAAQVDAAVANKRAPRARLEAACAAHLEMLLDRSDYAQVVVRVLPQDAEPIAASLIALREDYERRFRDLIAALPLSRRTDRSLLRLALLGALNGAKIWYRSGQQSPASIARGVLQTMVPAA